MHRRDFLRAGALLGASGLSLSTSTRADAHPGPYEPFGHVDVEGAKEAVVSPDGTVAYLAATTGYVTVDISTPDRPSVLAEIRNPVDEHENGPLRGIFDVKLDVTDPDTLVVVGPANPLPNVVAGALVVDVSDPAAPERVSFFETQYPIHNCFVRDGHAYLTRNDGEANALVVIDLESGETVGEWSLTDADEAWADVPSERRPLHDVSVYEDTAYLAYWDAGTWILDVSSPADPTLLGSVAAPDPSELSGSPSGSRGEALVPPGNHHYVATDESGTLLGVGKESWAQRIGGNDEDSETRLIGGPSGIDLWDVSDPAAPEYRSTIDPPPSPDPTFSGVWTTAHNFEFHDGRLYSAWYRGGVKRHDVSDPTNPEQLTWWRMPDEASFWTAQLATPGAETGYFVGTSWGTPNAPSRLYTFPDHAGQQASPPDLMANASNGSTTDSLVGTAASGTNGSSQTQSRTDHEADTTTAGTPGFGTEIGAGALGIASWRLLQRARRE
ncbi:LVIVD repeat-containing protein [Halogeometricum borinquense]|uniref:LVIVD repeat-containing protein n=1 Tax=Halogeometricum borinquense TaxID=60847 RepID=UPI00344887C0